MAVTKVARERGCPSFLGWLCRLWRIIARRPRGGDPCVRLPGRVTNKPDPCIYSQFMLMQLELPVTWDNPDVRILSGGAEVDSYSLVADTAYDLENTVHNSSRTEPAPGTQVHVRWVEFGAGGQVRHPIASVPTNVPVWPGTSIVHVAWRTPAVPGHYCIEVEVAHPADGNPANNRGWNNTQVRAASSPITEAIRVFNIYPDGCPPVREGGKGHVKPHRVLLGWAVLGAVAGIFAAAVGDEPHTVLRTTAFIGGGYVALALVGSVMERLTVASRARRMARAAQPHRTACERVDVDVDSYVFADDIGKQFDPEAAFVGKAPMWPATVEPASFMFSAGELFRDVVLTVDAPDDPGHTAAFNVNVRQGGVAAGGVTITVHSGG